MNRLKNEWKERILVMPVVSVGNVGQLAVDLLLSTLEVKDAGYLYDECVLPIVGADPFNPMSKKLVTSWQVYDCPAKNLVIVQQRAPVTPKSKKKYEEYVMRWIQQHKFKMTVLLSSSFSHFFTYDELQGVPMHYLCTRKVDPAIENNLKELSWKQFHLRKMEDFADSLNIPGGGVTKELFENCDKSELALVAMIIVCSEGNNYPEALNMTEELNKWLKLLEDRGTAENKWKIPSSWCLPFGNSPPSTMY